MSTSINSNLLNPSTMSARRIGRSDNGFLAKLWGFALFVLMSVGVFLIATILLTYQKGDPGFSHVSSSGVVHNILGSEGAWIADLVYLLFGWGAWVAVIGSFYFVARGWKRLRGKTIENTWCPFGFRILAFVLLILSACTLFFLRFHSHSDMLPGTTGGVIGSAIGTELLFWTDNNIATLVVVLLILLTSSIFFGFSWVAVCESIGRFIEGIVKRFNSRREDKEDKDFGEAAKRARQLHLNQSMENGAAVPASNPGIVNDRSAESIPVEPPISSAQAEQPKPETAVAEPLVFKPVPKEDICKIDLAPIEVKQIRPVQPAVDVQPELPLEQAEAAPEQYAAVPDEIGEEHEYVLPDVSLLEEPPYDRQEVSQIELQRISQRIEHLLSSYKIKAKVLSAMTGPVITRYKVQPGEGVPSKKFVSVAKDLARGLGLPSLRVVENMREIDSIGLEVPNSNSASQTIFLKEIINSPVFKQSQSPLTLALGKDVAGAPMVMDLASAPHLLVAGSTGSGKSVGINAMILSLIYKNTPKQLRLILVDPKEVEFAPYEDLPHLLTPVITDMNDAARALAWAVREMDRRYKLMKKTVTRNFESYNEKVRLAREQGQPLKDPFSTDGDFLEEIPHIIIIIDELADLLLTNGKEVEKLIMRITQKARAAGMHMILATQRPSTDIVTPIIKTNCPSRISFRVANRFDSTTILGSSGAEELLGRGDMLYLRPSGGLTRIHGTYVTDEEIGRVTAFVREQAAPEYVEGVTDEPEEPQEEAPENTSGGEGSALFDKAVAIVINDNKASISYLQRRLSIGYNRAANLIEEMERQGIVSEPNSTGKRQVLSRRPTDEYDL